MDNVNIVQLSITIPAQVGAITNMRKNKLDEILIKTNRFANNINTPLGLVYISKSNDENLIINSNRIAYVVIGKTFNDKNEKILLEVFDILLLDDNVNLSIDIQCNSQCIEDSHENSKKIFNRNFNNALDNKEYIYGVGYRFLFNTEDTIGEYKVEPLINDKTKYFYQYIANLKKNINLKNISDNISIQMNYMKEKFEDIINIR